MKKPIQFGKYWLLDRINVGGMAEVFKAKAFGVEGFERLLAVKRILPNIAEDEEFITMFIDEAKIAVQLNHANICQIFDLGKVDDSYFIALEFVHGKDLRAIFDRCKQKPVDGQMAMPIAQACFVIMKACEGLDYAHNKRDQQTHELNLVHRDVSPQNVLISYEGEVKLIDFGIAKAAGKASKTQQGILKGKFGYMSPEQVRGLPLDRRSDIFSLGIVLYELLTGERLFVGESDFSTLEKVRNVEILPPSTYNRRISDELERIVMKALAKDVDDRYQNAIDLHDDLQAYMYTAGEFYSRKDLAAWMKRVFVGEIEAENAKLEGYRQMVSSELVKHSTPIQVSPGGVSAPPGGRKTLPPPPPPGAMSTGPTPPARVSGQHAAVAPPPPSPMPARPTVNGHVAVKPSGEELGWDDEELATNIYDTPPDAGDAVIEDKPDLSAIDLSTDGKPVPHRSVSAPHNIVNPAAAAPAPSPAAQNGTGPSRAMDFVVPMPAQPMEAPLFGRPPEVRRPQSRTALWAGLGALVAVMIAGGVGAYFFLGNKPGEVVITSEPAANVQVLVDNKRVPVDGTPATLKLEPGSYVLTVQREGYVPWNGEIEVKAGETMRRRVVLEPLASGTGFTLISEPAGAQAILDGNTLEGVTPLKVQSVAPGKHKIEVRGPGGATWSQEISLDPGQMMDLRATLAIASAKPPAPLAPGMKDPKPAPAPKEAAKPDLTGAKPPVPEKTKPAPAPAPAPKEVAKPAPAPAPKEVAKPAPAPKEVAKPAPAPKPAPAVVAVAKPAPAPKETPAAKPKKDLPRLPDEEKPKAKAKPALADEEDLAPVAPPPKKPAGDGYLRLGSKPWTFITVDGKETGLHTPQTQMKLPGGSHRITLTNPQFNIKETFSVEVKAGETVTVTKDLRQQGADTD